MIAISELQKAITQQLDQPKELEKTYRENKEAFQQAFTSIFPDIAKHPSAQIWHERLHYQEKGMDWGRKNELIIVLLLTFVAGLIAQIPQYFSIAEDVFFSRNIAFIVWPMLAAFFAWKQNLGPRKWLFPGLALVLSAVYINVLPNFSKSDTIVLACMHLPLFLWTVVGYSFVGGDWKASKKKIDFLRYNGNLVVLGAIMLLSAALFSGITIGSFGLIGLNIEEFYAKHIIVWGAPAIPIVATYLVYNNQSLVNKISPIIAKLFTPLVCIMLFVFLTALLSTGKNVFNNREFLMLFNALLIGVLALILFSITEATKTTSQKITIGLLLVLSLLTIILNAIALSMIVGRLLEFGVTPNRIAVVGANVLIFINLILVAYKLFRVLKGKLEIQQLENVIALFVPVYAIWAAFVSFILPLIFQFK